MTSTEDFAAFQLDDSNSRLHLDGIDDFHRAAVTLLDRAQREVLIITPDFEPERYNNREFAEALSAFARRHRESRVKVLLGDPAIALQWGHHCLPLIQRLPSHIELRRVHPDDYAPSVIVMIADQIGLLRRDNLDGYIGVLDGKAIPVAQQRSRQFHELWRRATPVPEFRRLSL